MILCHSVASVADAGVGIGVGIGVIPDFCVPQLSNEVVDVLPSFELPTNTVYALNPFTSNTPIAIQLCVQALEEKLKKNSV